MKNKVKKDMEYEEAPSGYVTLYNYKEPFMPYRNGTGYLGVLLFDGETDKVQCHLCGEWYVALGNHLHKEHAMTASSYKEEVGLNQSTALIGEKMREKLVAAGQNRFKNLKPGVGKGGKVSEETKKKISNTLKANSLENKNMRGSCPAQLIYRLQKLYQKYGRTPTTYEISFYDALKLTYGSLKEACVIAGIPYRREGQTIDNPRWYKKEQVLNFVSSFLKREKRFPSRKDFITENVEVYWDKIKRAEWNYRDIKAEAMKLTGEYIPTGTRIKHTKENLIWYLQNFEKVHGRRPAISDTKRRLLPYASAYYYYFKTWKTALEEAFPK